MTTKPHGPGVTRSGSTVARRRRRRRHAAHARAASASCMVSSFCADEHRVTVARMPRERIAWISSLISRRSRDDDARARRPGHARRALRPHAARRRAIGWARSASRSRRRRRPVRVDDGRELDGATPSTPTRRGFEVVDEHTVSVELPDLGARRARGRLRARGAGRGARRRRLAGRRVSRRPTCTRARSASRSRRPREATTGLVNSCWVT